MKCTYNSLTSGYLICPRFVKPSLGLDPFATRSDDEESLLSEVIGKRVAEPTGDAGDDDSRILREGIL